MAQIVVDDPKAEGGKTIIGEIPVKDIHPRWKVCPEDKTEETTGMSIMDGETTIFQIYKPFQKNLLARLKKVAGQKSG